MDAVLWFLRDQYPRHVGQIGNRRQGDDAQRSVRETGRGDTVATSVVDAEVSMVVVFPLYRLDVCHLRQCRAHVVNPLVVSLTVALVQRAQQPWQIPGRREQLCWLATRARLMQEPPV